MRDGAISRVSRKFVAISLRIWLFSRRPTVNGPVWVSSRLLKKSSTAEAVVSFGTEHAPTRPWTRTFWAGPDRFRCRCAFFSNLLVLHCHFGRIRPRVVGDLM